MEYGFAHRNPLFLLIYHAIKFHMYVYVLHDKSKNFT